MLGSEFSDDDIGIEDIPLALPTLDGVAGSLYISAVLERMKSVDMNDKGDIQKSWCARIGARAAKTVNYSVASERFKGYCQNMYVILHEIEKIRALNQCISLPIMRRQVRLRTL